MTFMHRIRTFILSLLAVAALNPGVAAADLARKVKFDIAPQQLPLALLQYSRQSGVQVTSVGMLIEGKLSGGVVGTFEARGALEQLLKDTDLRYDVVGENTVLIIGKTSQPLSSTPRAIEQIVPQDMPMRLARQESPEAAAQTAAPAQSAADKQKESEVIVTGTRLRGVKDQFSPVKSITREDMELAGHTRLAEVFDSLPQNFGGGVTLDTLSAATLEGPGAVSVNLRGLGNEATLILLNGRRLAAGGRNGSFTDISAIPTSAIDRIEVMTDGASAIYGSDAIAGVVNIILRRDFSGAESVLNFGAITDGGGDTVRAAQSFGWSGTRAHGLIAYEYASEGELNANDKDFTRDQPDPFYLMPSNEKNGVMASGGVQLSERLRLSGDGYYNKRRTEGYTAGIGGSGLFQDYQDVDARQFGAALGLNARLSGDWEADLSGTFSEQRHRGAYTQISSPTLGGQDIDSKSRIDSLDLSVGGTLFPLLGEGVRGVVGTHLRKEEIDQFNRNRPAGAVLLNVEKEREVFAAYGELYVPVPGVRRLALTAAARYDDYDDVGSSFDPKFGLVWSPTPSLNLRGTWGTSFRVARLDQLIERIDLVSLLTYVDPQAPGGQSVIAEVWGTTDQLEPEEAETWSVGFDFTPEAVRGLSVRGTYFNYLYDGRIAAPSRGSDLQGRAVNYTGLPIRNVSQQTVQALVARAASTVNFSLFFPSMGNLTFNDVTVILERRPLNTLASKVDGIDLEVNYDVPTARGDWAFSLNATRLLTFEQQFSPVTVVERLLNTYANPVDLRVRAGAAWSLAPFTAALHVNYVDGYIDDEQPAGARPVGSWTTLDATMRLDLGAIFDKPLARDAFLSFGAVNLFNTDPPAVGVITLMRSATYDAANADPTGRRVNLQLTKRW